VNASININDQQRTRVSQSIARLDVRPLTSVNFSVSVGTVVPRDVRLQQLPADVVEIVPQYRGYDFVVVKDEIVIVEPSSYKIVATLPYSGRSTASAPARSEERKTTFSDRDREVIRKHAKARPVEREKHVTTGSTVRTEIRTGERLPEGVEVETFPEEVYRDAPTLREYRYINRDSHTYIVEPRERRVIEEID
jgi:multidrug efflux pump subunit AcrA (membrane-fusion protein)